MKKSDLSLLIGEIRKTIIQIDKMNQKYINFSEKRNDFPDNFDLIVLAEIITDYYTCLETAFVRISKAFENNLEKYRRHANLLERMIVEIPGVRKALLTDRSYNLLKEIMRFRHFKRYYFESDYDKDRIDFLEKKYNEVVPLVLQELELYITFLQELIY
jgi:HepT-like protein